LPTSTWRRCCVVAYWFRSIDSTRPGSSPELFLDLKVEKQLFLRKTRASEKPRSKKISRPFVVAVVAVVVVVVICLLSCGIFLFVIVLQNPGIPASKQVTTQNGSLRVPNVVGPEGGKPGIVPKGLYRLYVTLLCGLVLLVSNPSFLAQSVVPGR
jgi:hypothetical protein